MHRGLASHGAPGKQATGIFRDRARGWYRIRRAILGLDRRVPMTTASAALARRVLEFAVGPAGSASLTIRGIEWPSSDPRPILFLHGGGANAEWWADVAPRFRDVGRAIALDLRGHGDSDAPAGGPYGFTAFGGDVLAVLRDLGRPAALVGASMGGLVAMYVAARTPLVERLVVVDSPLRPAPGVSERRRRLSTPKRYASREEAVSRFRILPSGTSAAPATVRRIAERSIRELSDGTWQLKYDPSMFIGARRRGVESVAAKIKAPLLFLRGEKSDLVTEDSLHDLQTAVPHAQVRTLAGTNHHLFLDDPEGFVAAVHPFLAARGD